MVVVGVMALMILGTFAWCRSLDPDEGKAKREIERVIPDHMVVLSVGTGQCGIEIISQCTIVYKLDGDPVVYIEDGRAIRANLLESNWKELRYSENNNHVFGSYRKDAMALVFEINSIGGRERCGGCSNHILVNVD